MTAVLRELSAPRRGELGSVGEAQGEGGVTPQMVLRVGPCEAAGNDDGGLMHRAWALPDGGHMTQGPFDARPGQSLRRNLGELWGEPVAPELVVAAERAWASACGFEMGEIGGLAQPLEAILAELDWVSGDAPNSAEADAAVP